MSFFFYRLIALLAIVDVSWCQWSMEGKTQTFKFAINNYGYVTNINWIFQNGNRNTTLFLCSSANVMRCDAVDDTTLDLYSANITSNSSSIISVFTIKNVSLSLHNTGWFYTAEFNTNISFHETSGFNLYVFTPAESPTCDEVKLLNESNIQITCWTKKVFPASVCLFNVNFNVSSEYELKQGHISYTQEQNLTTLYYKTTCTLVVSAAILGPGTHMFRVVMYPNITSGITEDMQRRSQYTSSIYLGYPKTLLGTNCEVEGYIMENEQSNCTCLDISNSILPTQIIWFTNRLIILEKGTSLVFTAKRKESFKCTISNRLNWTDTVDFQPNILYPPDIVSVNITKQVFDLCNDTDIVISGTCFVSESNPEPSIAVNIDNSVMDITSSKYEREYVFNIIMKNAGIYNISCLANSKEYSKIVSRKTIVTIKGPSGIPNIFINKNEEIKFQPNNLMTITQGDTITCQSKGGYPILKNISLTCGTVETSATRKVDQDQVSMTLNMINVTSGNCECIVWQESNCLQNTTTVQFEFITSLNDDSTTVQLSEGAISGIVIAVILVLATIALIIFLVGRARGKCYNKPQRRTENERHNYNHVVAAQYVNTEMHAYERINIQANYLNVIPAATTFCEEQHINQNQASTQYVNTELSPYETTGNTESYYNKDYINDISNDINSHEYETVNNTDTYCNDEIDDINVQMASGSEQ
ncbi:unnamed protein product [Lymnaea stagnalis]|uniref:Ig-like domain-containing protein n=1 Tax=Lymnaea stagnalis TaxID=6523 RepID=A0AAV2ILI4_LYMST